MTTNPVFTYTAACNLFDATAVANGNHWVLDNKETNDFAASLSASYARNNGWTYKQWDSAIKASRGVTFKKKERARTAEPSTATPAPRVANKRERLSPVERASARKAISQAAGWKEYAAQNAINTASLSGDMLYAAADALGVNVRESINAANAAKVKESAKLFNSVGDGEEPSTGAGLSRQAVREIAREEITARLQPVIQKVVIVEKDGKTRGNSADVTHPEFDSLAQAVVCRDFSGNRLNVMLVGPTGTGKSYACKQLAAVMGLPFHFQSQADESFALVGYERVNGDMKYTPFVTAFRDGGVCLLDELDRYSPKALTALNAALANGRMTLDNGEVITRHPDFICVGAANTMGLGATADFTAAEKLDLSTISRFSVRLDWAVHAATEDSIAASKAEDADIARHWLAECRKVRIACERAGLPYLADQRAVESGANLLAAGMPLAKVREITYLAAMDADQRATVLAVL